MAPHMLPLADVLYNPAAQRSDLSSQQISDTVQLVDRTGPVWLLLRFPTHHAAADRALRGDHAGFVHSQASELTCFCDGRCGLPSDVQGV